MTAPALLLSMPPPGGATGHPVLGPIRAGIERVFLDAGESLIAMDTRFNELRGPLGELADRAPDVLGAVAAYARDLTAAVETLDAELAARSGDIDALRRDVGVLHGKITSIARSLKMMQFVATNARIHVFALRPRHARLESFADNARALLAESATVLGRVEESVSHATADLAVLTLRAIPRLRNEVSALRPTFAGLQRAVTQFGGDRRNESTFGRPLATHVDRLRTEFDAVIVSLQSGDRASQRIDHVERILAEAEAIPGAEILAALGHALLASAFEDLDGETARIVASLNEGASRFEEIAGLQGTETLEHRLNAFTGLLDGVGRAQSAVDGIRDRRAQLVRITETVTGHMSDLREILGDMASLAEDLRLVGTNAVLASAELAEDGDALREIAGQMRLLAAESAEELKQVLTALVDTDVRITGLIGEIGGGMAGAITAIADRGAGTARDLDEVFQAGRQVAARSGELVASIRKTVPSACRALQAQVARLGEAVGPGAAPVRSRAGATAAEAEALARAWASYTMDAERDIHRAVCRKHGIDIPEDTGPSGHAPEIDIFF